MVKWLESLNPSKASGIHGITGKFLKEEVQCSSSPITQLCNLLISLSTFPEKCKIAKLKPMFKKGYTTEPKRYRLISKLIEEFSFVNVYLSKKITLH